MDKNQPYGQSKRANRVGMFENRQRRPSPIVVLIGICALIVLIVLLLVGL